MRQTRRIFCALAAATILVRRTAAQVPESHATILARGINVVHWFRFPPRNDAAALQAYLSDAALATLRRLGFTYIRLPVQPEIVLQPNGEWDRQKLAALLQAIKRIQQAGLGAMVEPHPHTWQLESSALHRQMLLAFWRGLAPALRPLPAQLTFPEVLNEPVFPDGGAWARLQQDVLAVIRQAMPRHTIVLTGANWGSLDGLRGLSPVADRNVIYSFHSYEPQILTTLAAFEPGLDKDALARLPFPVTDAAACAAAVRGSAHARTREIGRYYCGQGWNAQKVAQDIAQSAAAWGRRHQASVALTEFGAIQTLNREARLGWISAMRAACDAAGLPWALWGLDDGMGFALRITGPGLPDLDAGLLAALGLRA